jgi:hypothetical protein
MLESRMQELVTSGRIVDIVMLVMVAELALLMWLSRRLSGKGFRPAAIIANIAAGGALVMSLRLALTGTTWGWIAACLVAAFLAHAIDIGIRLRDALGTTAR